jgi:hypothetical protein
VDQRVKSSLHVLEIIKFVSSSCLKTLAFLHLHRMQVKTVLLTLELFSRIQMGVSTNVFIDPPSGPEV